MKCITQDNSNNLGIALRNVNILIKRSMENSPVKKEMDNVTGMHGYIIGYLKSRGSEDVFQRDVEQRFSMRRSTATAILQLMEKNGLIIRSAVDYDARLKRIQLTEKAERMVFLFEEDRKRMEEIMKSGLSEKELTTLLELLGKVKNNLLKYQIKECE